MLNEEFKEKREKIYNLPQTRTIKSITAKKTNPIFTINLLDKIWMVI